MTRADIPGPVSLARPWAPRVGDLVRDTRSDQVAPVILLWQPETGGELRAYLEYPFRTSGGRFVAVSLLAPLSGSLGGAG